MNCPNCQSVKIQKKGKRAGKQRYRCKECGASFTENVEYIPQISLDPVTDIECPQCGNTLISRDGKLPSGNQRYKCSACGLRFSPGTFYLHKDKIQYNCPYCEGELSYSGHTKTGNQKYKCKNCGKSCSSDTSGKPIKRELPFRLTNTEKKCPSCGTLNVKRIGYSKNGIQRYKCRDCGKIFSDNTKDRPNLSQAIGLLLTGASLQKAATLTNYSKNYLRKLMVPYYLEESISKEQEALIIKYGYHLRVPIDYMAEYVKCSEHKCREVLQKYRERIKSTIHDAI